MIYRATALPANGRQALARALQRHDNHADKWPSPATLNCLVEGFR